MKQRRVFEISHWVFPKAAANARLRMLVLKLSRQTTTPTNSAVGAGHIRDRGSGFRGFETICLRNHVSDLITTPTVSLNADVRLVNKTFIDHGLNGGQHALQSTASRIADRINDVRHEDQIAVTDIVSWIDRRPRARIAESIPSLLAAFIDINDHRVLLFW